MDCCHLYNSPGTKEAVCIAPKIFIGLQSHYFMKYLNQYKIFLLLWSYQENHMRMKFLLEKQVLIFTITQCNIWVCSHRQKITSQDVPVAVHQHSRSWTYKCSSYSLHTAPTMALPGETCQLQAVHLEHFQHFKLLQGAFSGIFSKTDFSVSTQSNFPWTS